MPHAPSTPALAPRVGQLLGTVYSHLVRQFGAFEGERYPLHVGDTWLQPPPGCATEDLTEHDHPGINRYTPVPGAPALREAIRQRVARRSGVEVAEDEVAVTAGATGGLCAVLGTLVGPGDEVMILAPAWPLIAGMTTAFGGTPVHVPFLGLDVTPEGVAGVLDAHRTDRTVAVYVNTPNNPTGLVIGAPVLQALVDWARRHGLWIVSDEVYEDLSYVGPHTYVRSLAPERTISAWSFSKGFGMAGNRVGYVVGPAEVVAGCHKLSTYTFYCAPHVGQLAGLRAFGEQGEAWVADTRQRYARIGAQVADRLGLAHPQGSTFLFIDLEPFVGDLPLEEVLRRCVARGLLVAPGTAFGPYPHHIRLCFTAVEPERTLRGVDVLAEVLGV